MDKSRRIRKIFYKLVEDNFFESYKIKPFFHNRLIENLGKPSKNNWSDVYCGYILVYGRYGNGNTIVTFKLRNDKLLIFRYDTDDEETCGKIYLGHIKLKHSRKYKIEKIKERIENDM